MSVHVCERESDSKTLFLVEQVLYSIFFRFFGLFYSSLFFFAYLVVYIPIGNQSIDFVNWFHNCLLWNEPEIQFIRFRPIPKLVARRHWHDARKQAGENKSRTF